MFWRRKNMKKQIIAIIMAGAMVLSFTACNKDDDKDSKKSSEDVTVESLLEDASANYGDIESFAMGIDVDYDVDLGIFAEPENATDNVKATFEYCEDAMHMTIEASEESPIGNREIYVDNGEGLTYTYNDDENGWVKSETAANENQMDMASGKVDELLTSLKDNADDLTLEDDTEKIEGESAYVITGLVSSDIIIDMLLDFEAGQDVVENSGLESIDFETILADLQEAFGENFEEVDIDITLWIYEESHQFAGLSFDGTELMQNVVETIMDMPATFLSSISPELGMFAEEGITMRQLIESLGSMMSSMSEDPGAGYGFEYSINQYDMEFTLYAIDDTTVEIPDDVIDSAVTSDSTGGFSL